MDGITYLERVKWMPVAQVAAQRIVTHTHFQLFAGKEGPSSYFVFRRKEGQEGMYSK